MGGRGLMHVEVKWLRGINECLCYLGVPSARDRKGFTVLEAAFGPATFDIVFFLLAVTCNGSPCSPGSYGNTGKTCYPYMGLQKLE